MKQARTKILIPTMTMAGLYDGSGRWAWYVGLPAKSGVGGGIVAVMPGKGAIAVFAPPLDEAGNSVKAQRCQVRRRPSPEFQAQDACHL
jgi:glutaminase